MRLDGTTHAAAPLSLADVLAEHAALARADKQATALAKVPDLDCLARSVVEAIGGNA